MKEAVLFRSASFYIFYFLLNKYLFWFFISKKFIFFWFFLRIHAYAHTCTYIYTYELLSASLQIWKSPQKNITKILQRLQNYYILKLNLRKPKKQYIKICLWNKSGLKSNLTLYNTNRQTSIITSISRFMVCNLLCRIKTLRSS